MTTCEHGRAGARPGPGSFSGTDDEMNPCPRCGADLVALASTDDSAPEYVCPDGCPPGAGADEGPEPEPADDDWPPTGPYVADLELGEVVRRRPVRWTP